MYKPNLQLPLATSHNQRGVSGFTNVVTNRIDQQKINSMYEVTKNSITGQGQLKFTKRPGVADGGLALGTSTQAAYFIFNFPGVGGLFGSNRIVYATDAGFV